MAIDFRAPAQFDIAETVEHLEQSDPRLAFRFLEAVRHAAELAEMFPDLGRHVHTRNSALDGSRCLILRRFRNHVLYYKVVPDGIIVLRVLRGSRNIDKLD